jgi:hypothetical protein
MKPTLVELLTVIAIIGVFFAMIPAGPATQDTLFYFLFGWVWGLWRFVVGFVNEPVAVGFGVLAFLLLPIAIHIFVAQIAKRLNKQWTFKKSFAVSSLTILIAGAGIATIGGVHEIIWLFGGKEPFTENRNYSTRTIALRHGSGSKLRRLGYQIIANNNSRLFGGTILDDGRLGHGWMTRLLPLFEEQDLYSQIDFSKPWNDPVNADVFRRRVLFNESPYFLQLPEAEQKDQNGLAKTDYAANQFVLPAGKPIRLADNGDGETNTILAGEVVQNLQPWGSPLNSRDPKLGINKSPYGFGSKHIGGVNFVFGDANVKFLSDNTDQKILEAYATPNGGEPETKEVTK